MENPTKTKIKAIFMLSIKRCAREMCKRFTRMTRLDCGGGVEMIKIINKKRFKIVKSTEISKTCL